MPVNLTWTDDSNAAEGYRVYRANKAIDTANLPKPLAQLDGTARDFTDKYPVIGQTYYYLVQGYNAAKVVFSEQKTAKIEQGYGTVSFYDNDFETGDLSNFSGDWAITDKWFKTGSKGFGSTNQKKASTTSTTVFSMTIEIPCTLSFDWATVGEANCDWMSVVINGVEVLNTSQNVTGLLYTGTFTRSLGVGQLVMQFSYRKDTSADYGIDGAYIDNLKVIPI